MGTILDRVLDLPEEEEEDAGVRVRPWTRDEFRRAYHSGVFAPGERLELIQGVIYEKGERTSEGIVAAQYTPHYTSVRAVTKVMERAFGEGYEVRPQGPLDVGRSSDPEPDVTVVTGSITDYARREPTAADARLVIEVSDTTVRYDGTKKAALYAEAGIVEYWQVVLKTRELVVYRDPGRIPDSGFGYRSVERYSESRSVAPLAKPDSVVPVSDLLPPE